MSVVNDIFDHGASAVIEHFSRPDAAHILGEMDAKELADICWTRASTLAKVRRVDARIWAQAALAGYQFLEQSGNAATARSASENAAALRAWPLLQEATSPHPT